MSANFATRFRSRSRMPRPWKPATAWPGILLRPQRSPPRAPEEDLVPARAAMARTSSPEKDANREEIVMSANDTPPGGFPKSIHGYNVGAVDDYVRKINSRLESLLSQVQSESVRADQS